MALFQQQGELDYVAFSNSFLSSSYQVIQRLTAAGISPLTCQAGLLLSARFRLGELGHRRVSLALSNLRTYYGYESVLWFGFGHKSFLATLTERETGFNCAAICAAFAEAFGPTRSAEILQALWRTEGLSDDLEPSRSQLQALVEGCSGLFLATPFPDVLRRMSGPYAHSSHPLNTRQDIRSPDFAEVISALFKISKGNLKAIHVYGAREIAFLGAIAHWLFDLAVWVEDNDGTTIFSTCLHPDQSNIWLHYTGLDPGPHDSLIQISTTTFVLGSIEDLIIHDNHSCMNIRIKWDCIFAHVFYDDTNRILAQAALLGKAIGAIARVYKALNFHELDVGGLSRLCFTNFRECGYGAGFVGNICTIFPEIGGIKIFQRKARENLNLSVSDSVQAI